MNPSEPTLACDGFFLCSVAAQSLRGALPQHSDHCRANQGGDPGGIPVFPFYAWLPKELRGRWGIVLGPARFTRLRALLGLDTEEQAKPAITDSNCRLDSFDNSEYIERGFRFSEFADGGNMDNAAA